MKKASSILVSLTILVLMFHFLVLSGILPYTVVWAGKLKSKEEMYVFESISILLNLLIFYVVLQRNHWAKALFSVKLQKIILWSFAVLFALNTVGNLFAENVYELYIGTTLTALSAFLCWRVAKG